jgi:class 3 adenylate cyclase
LLPRSAWPAAITGAVLVLFAALQVVPERLAVFQLLERLEWITYDWRVKQAGPTSRAAPQRFGFAFISDDAIAVFDDGTLGTNFHFGLKWPRHVYGHVVRELKAQGARAVGLDILFGERRTYDKLVDTPAGPIQPDVFFLQQLILASNVVLGATRQVPPHALFLRGPGIAQGDISTDPDSDGVLRRAKAFHDYRLWHPDIRSEARLQNWDLDHAQVSSNQVVFPVPRGRGFVLPLTEDGLFAPSDVSARRPRSGLVRLQPPFRDARVWHMGIVLAALDLGLDLDRAVVELDKRRITLRGTNGVRRVLPLDRQGRFLIEWTLRPNDPRLTQEAFESLVGKSLLRAAGSNIFARFRDKLVIVGSTATGNELSDRGATPMNKDTFLTSNNWNVANSILTDQFIRPYSDTEAILAIAVLGVGAGLLTWRLRISLAALSVILLGVAYVWLGNVAFVERRIWLPIVLPLGGLLFVHLALLSYKVFFEQAEKRRVRQVFSKIVSPNVVSELLTAENLSLVGARRKVTVLFADVRGFTELTDQAHAQAEAFVRAHRLEGEAAEACYNAQAQDILQTVNLYLGMIADTVIHHHGTLDKYIGDCVMAFWGAPTPNPHHARDCVRAAIDAQRAIAALNVQRAAQNQQREQANVLRIQRGEAPLPPLHCLALGTGINTGVVATGLMGSDAHIVNYTVFGREVNLASRLEHVSDRNRIIIGEATYQELLRDDPALAARSIEREPVSVKGIRGLVKIYEVLWKPDAPPEGLKP